MNTTGSYVWISKWWTSYLVNREAIQNICTSPAMGLLSEGQARDKRLRKSVQSEQARRLEKSTQKNPSESFDSFEPQWVSTRTKWLKNVWKMCLFVCVVTHYGSNESNDSLGVFSDACYKWTTGDQENIIFPPLYIKLGLMKEFVKVLNTEENRCQYILLAFPGLRFEKVKTGVFDAPQIRQLIKDQSFITSYDSCREKSMGSQKLFGQWQGWKIQRCGWNNTRKLTTGCNFHPVVSEVIKIFSLPLANVHT